MLVRVFVFVTTCCLFFDIAGAQTQTITFESDPIGLIPASSGMSMFRSADAQNVTFVAGRADAQIADFGAGSNGRAYAIIANVGGTASIDFVMSIDEPHASSLAMQIHIRNPAFLPAGAVVNVQGMYMGKEASLSRNGIRSDGRLLGNVRLDADKIDSVHVSFFDTEGLELQFPEGSGVVVDDIALTTASSSPGGNDGVSPTQWSGRFSTQQVVGNTQRGLFEDRGFANLAFDNLSTMANINMALPAANRVVSVTLHCAAAGETGPVVARLVDAPGGRRLSATGWLGSLWLVGADILPAGQESNCGLPVNNIASLRAAADARKLYIQAELQDADSEPVRAQLFRDMVRVVKVHVASDQVVSSDGNPVTARGDLSAMLFFSRRLNAIRYTTDFKPGATSIVGFRLRCAPPGQNGPVISQRFNDALRDGEITNTSVAPADATSTCGMTINNIASMYEAFQSGHLYLETTKIFTPGSYRGQILAQ